MDPEGPRAPPTPPAKESARETNRLPFTSYVLLVLLILTPALVGTALTLKSQLDGATKDARAARTELAAQAERNASQQAQLAALKRETAETQARVQEDAERLRDLARSHQDLGTQLEAAGDAVTRLRSDLERFSERAGLSADGGVAAIEVDGAAATSAGDPRCATLAGELRAMRKAGAFDTAVEKDAPVLRVAGDALFVGASDALRPEGRILLQRIGGALARSPWDGPLTVAVYGDDRAPSGASTWEPTAVQAAHVVDFLRSQGLQLPTMAAVGYGSSEPGSGEVLDAGRGARRIEIVLGAVGHCGPELRDEFRRE